MACIPIIPYDINSVGDTTTRAVRPCVYVHVGGGIITEVILYEVDYARVRRGTFSWATCNGTCRVKAQRIVPGGTDRMLTKSLTTRFALLVSYVMVFGAKEIIHRLVTRGWRGIIFSFQKFVAQFETLAAVPNLLGSRLEITQGPDMSWTYRWRRRWAFRWTYGRAGGRTRRGRCRFLS